MNDAIRLADAATRALDHARRIVLSRPVDGYREKSDRDPVTAVDLAVEHALRSELHAVDGGIGFQGEETGAADADGGRFWVLDPVDGTVNLAHGLPLCAVSLGLVVDGVAELAAVDLPFLGLRYTALRGRGTFCGDRRISCSAAGALREVAVAVGDFATGVAAADRNRARLAITAGLAGAAQRVRMLGSAATDFAWVAHGRLGAAVIAANKPWESAVGALLVREAGGVVVDLDGRPHTLASTSTVATTPRLAAELLNVLRRTADAPGRADRGPG